MRKFTVLILLMSAVCAYSQSKVAFKTGQEIDDKSFTKNGDKQILDYDDNTIYFLTGDAIGKITNGNHLAGSYTPNKKAEAFQTVATSDHVIQLTFLDWKLLKTTLSKSSMLPTRKDEVVKDFNAASHKGHYYKYKTAISPDKECTAISMMVFDNKDYIVSVNVFLFDKELNLIKDQKINLNFGGKTVTMNNLSMGNNKKAVLCLSTKSQSGSAGQLELCVISEEDEDFISIPLKGNYLVDYTAQFDKQGNILAAGYFGTPDGKNTTVTFSIPVEFASKTVGDMYVLNFPSNYDPSRPQFDSFFRKFRYSVKAREILFSEDNTACLVGYEYITLYVSGNDATLPPGIYQYSRNILLTKVTPEGQAEKLLFVEASTLAPSTGVPAPKSFYAVEDNGNIHVVYVDHVNNHNGRTFALAKDLYLFPVIGNNKDVCLIATLDPDGNLTNRMVYDNSQNKSGVMVINSLVFDPAKRCFTGFMADKWTSNKKPVTSGLKTVEITLP